VKIVDYVGSKKVEQTKIDEKLKENNSVIRLDSFLDPGLIKRVSNTIREMLAEKGYQFAVVTPQIKPVGGGPKLVNLTFQIEEGPQVKIRDLEFVGNDAFPDWRLARVMKSNKPQWFLSFVTGRGTFQEAKYEEDAEAVVGFYRDHGYIGVRVGEPELRVLEDSKDRDTRYVSLRIPVAEGERYKVGEVTFDGNTVVKPEPLRTLFKLKVGDWYSDKAIRKGLEKAREVYGAAGYFEFTGYPDLQPRDQIAREEEARARQAEGGEPAENGAPGEAQAQGQPGEATQAQADGPPAAAQPAGEGGQAAAKPLRTASGEPIVDVTMRLQEGKQYFVNRITFVGNTTTRDNVVRRELRLFENGVFNTEALKYSIKRINQLGYFKALEGGADVNVEKTPGADNKVDVTLKFEEQNRNQLTFGAGVSQWEGFFGQLSFQTANFMGRGETFTVSLQAGSRAQNYQVAFTEPYLFDRAITGGIDVFKRELRYISQFTQSSYGGNIIFGFPVRDFTRMFVNYSYENVRVKDINPIFTTPEYIAGNPYLADYLLLDQGGARTVSKIVPSLVHNTVDDPIFPKSGTRYTVSVDLAGLGGDTNFYKPRVEGVWYIPHTRRTSVGLRAQAEYISQFRGSKPLPVFERLYLGGEYSVRGFDIRTIGPKLESGLVIGGNKTLLFNVEYLITIADPVRLVFFYDAGQALDARQRFALKEFKTSTGAEVRFFMPVLNVPFRLIFAYNPQRDGVLDNNLQPQKAFGFRFAVGSTF
jgi:outer membrane protein insertion porin family